MNNNKFKYVIETEGDNNPSVSSIVDECVLIYQLDVLLKHKLISERLYKKLRKEFNLETFNTSITIFNPVTRCIL